MNGSVASRTRSRRPLVRGEIAAQCAGMRLSALTPAEAAEYLRLSRKKLDKILQRGEIRHKRIGRSILITKNALNEWLNAASTSNGKISVDSAHS